ncbi:DNA polymerase III subunit delta' [Colwellia psychrerythraea]|uniref:DNA-directed DNA polymerase n=1 Tax=Colwellia psychrerythraea (strain 34H / ATCC BAA-681) TaxID=167879 RepID=Q482J4_COLP3|nr:DNA polymerase III subunit delta' [Colwellia psychrerythraea]AAZ25121.1 DNA polymerase III, delta prime subunit [Colwellia psychrerythraea 34H]
MLQICHEKQVQLSRQYQQDTLAHAIIIQGIEGAGQGALAKWLIELLICQNPLSTTNAAGTETISEACGQCKACLLKKSDNYPDHLLLKSENKTLGVDDIRRGNAFLEKTAHLGKVKTILIPQAQVMTIAAANALLKTLEEPSANSYIVLITDDLDSLLPTIISRCAVYAIRPMIGEALLAQLKVSNLGDVQLSSSAPLTNKANDTAYINLSHLPELTDKIVHQEFQVFNQYLLDYLLHGQSEEKLLSQIVDNKYSLRWLEKITCNLMREYYLVNATDQTLLLIKQKISVQVLNQIYQAIITSNKLIKSYLQANRQFVGEQLLMTINDIVRP